MAPVITRLLLTLSLFVAAAVVYVVLLVTMFEMMRFRRSDEIVFGIANLITGALFAGGWVLIWLQEVRWTRLRISLTFAALVASIVPSLLLVVIGMLIDEFDGGLVVFLSGLTWLTLWLFGTSLAWMELPSERRRRHATLGLETVPCPSCGYNLAGLKETKCPECGASYTIDSLFAALREKEQPLRF